MHTVDQNFQTSLEALKDLIRTPGISHAAYENEALYTCAQKVIALFSEIKNAEVKEITVPGAPPYIIVDFISSKAKESVLGYCHYDVQPGLDAALWQAEPFTPLEKDGRLWGRGSADDKAGIVFYYYLLKRIQDESFELKYNLRILIEGEEEIGSPHFSQFIDENPDIFQVKALIVADLLNFDTGIPSFTNSLRGITALEINLKSMENALHSGMWGGPVPDVNRSMNHLLAQLVDPTGRIQIPELYEDLLPLSEEETATYSQLPSDESLFKNQCSLYEDVELCAHGSDIYKRMWREPELTINAIVSGDKGKTGNVLQNECYAKLGLRLAPGQQSQKAKALLIEKIKSLTPKGYKLEIKEEHDAEAWHTKPDNDFIQDASRAWEKAYQRKTMIIGSGGTIPLLKLMEDKLGELPMLLVGIEDPYSNAHGPNESVSINDLHKNCLALYYLMKEGDDHY